MNNYFFMFKTLGLCIMLFGVILIILSLYIE